MKKLIASVCLTAMSLAAAPAFAADDPATNTVLIPVRLLSFGVGTVIGTPISMIKHSVTNTGKFTEKMADKMGGKDNGLALFVSAPFALVGGTAVGVAQGAVDGPKNSVDNCVEHPFSAAAMSLGDEK